MGRRVARVQRKQKITIILVTVFLFLLSGFLLIGSYRLYRKRSLLVQQHAILRERLRELRVQNERVEEKLKLLSTEEGQRYLLKEYYGFGEKGERIIYLSR